MSFYHGYKTLVIKNKYNGRVETIRSMHNYNEGSRAKEEKRLKKEWSEGDYKCLKATLT